MTTITDPGADIRNDLSTEVLTDEMLARFDERAAGYDLSNTFFPRTSRSFATRAISSPPFPPTWAAAG